MKQVLEQVRVHAIPAFTDNYIWMMHDGSDAIVVDPGEAAPVEKTLAEMGLSLCAIVLTHLHYDHCWGVPALLERWPVPVFGPVLNDYDRATHPPFPKPGTVPLDCVTHPVGDGDRVVLACSAYGADGDGGARTYARPSGVLGPGTRAGVYRGHACSPVAAAWCSIPCRTWRSRWTDWPVCRSKQKSIAAMNTRCRTCALPLRWIRTTRRCLPATGPSKQTRTRHADLAVHHRAGKGHQPFLRCSNPRSRSDPRPYRSCGQHLDCKFRSPAQLEK